VGAKTNTTETPGLAHKPASSKSHLMKYILCCMRAEDKIHILFVFMSTKKNDFYDNMVDTKYVMRYNERLLTQFWPYHTGENIYYSCLTTVLAQSTGRHP